MQSSQQALKDRIGFAKDGCILAFGLSHSYPKTTGSLWAGLEDRLKGADAVLLQAVTRCGLTYSFKAAFIRELGEERMDVGRCGGILGWDGTRTFINNFKYSISE